MKTLSCFFLLFFVLSCKKKAADPVVVPAKFYLYQVKINNATVASKVKGVNFSPVIKLTFVDKIDHSAVAANVTVKNDSNTPLSLNISYEQDDSVIVVKPLQPLQPLSAYTINISGGLQSQVGGSIQSAVVFDFLQLLIPPINFQL